MFQPEDVRKIAALSALELTEEEVQQFAQQFTQILSHFEQLRHAQVTSSADRDEQFLTKGREDIAVASDVRPDQFSPYLEGDLFKVPRVIEQN